MRTEKEIREKLREVLDLEKMTKCDMTPHINMLKYVLGDSPRPVGVYNAKTGKYKLNPELMALYTDVTQKMYEERVANEA